MGQPTTVVAIILGCVGLANLGYAVFRMTEGKSDNAALAIAGATCLTLAAILQMRGRSSGS